MSEAQLVAPEVDLTPLRLSEEASRLGGVLQVGHQVYEAKPYPGITSVPRGCRGAK